MAKKNPSTRWFFKDWHEDEGLQLCSLAARGLWIELLVICAAADGYLLINGKAPSITALARFVRATPAQVRRLLAELEEHEVFSRTAEGTIFCRRMVRTNGNHKTPKGANREHDPNQPDMFEVEPPRTRDPPDQASKAFQEQETDLINSDRDSERPAGALGEIGDVAKPDEPPIMETPVGIVRPAQPGGTSDGEASLPSPVADRNRFGSQDQGRAYPLAGSASSPSTRFGALHGSDCRPAPRADRPRPPAAPAAEAGSADHLDERRAGREQRRAGAEQSNRDLPHFGAEHSRREVEFLPLAGSIGRQLVDAGKLGTNVELEFVGRGRHAGDSHAGRSCRSAGQRPEPGGGSGLATLASDAGRRKSPATKARIKQQLQAKHGRFLVACRPQREVEAYWAAMLGDDAVEAQRVFDAVDRRMRAMRWDDNQHGVAA